jgi:hypothetical protein
MELADLRRLEEAMRVSLAELYARASNGERSTDLSDLAQRVRDLLQMLDAGLAEVPPDPDVDALRGFARAITGRLAAIERELAGGRLH